MVGCIGISKENVIGSGRDGEVIFQKTGEFLVDGDSKRKFEDIKESSFENR